MSVYTALYDPTADNITLPSGWESNKDEIVYDPTAFDPSDAGSHNSMTDGSFKHGGADSTTSDDVSSQHQVPTDETTVWQKEISDPVGQYIEAQATRRNVSSLPGMEDPVKSFDLGLAEEEYLNNVLYAIPKLFQQIATPVKQQAFEAIVQTSLDRLGFHPVWIEDYMKQVSQGRQVRMVLVRPCSVQWS